MLPLIRVLVPGGFLIVTLGLVAGFAAPAGSRAQFVRLEAPARGPLIAQREHPEWKQFLIQAAVRRAYEVEQLLELPGQKTLADAAPEPKSAAEQTAGLPGPAEQPKPDDQTGAITDAAINEVIPIDLGESSSTELPIGPPQTIPVIEKPQRLQLPDESAVQPAAVSALTPVAVPKVRPAAVPKARAAKARTKRKPKAAEPEQTNPFLSLFGGSSAK